MKYAEVSGGQYCQICKRCIKPPRKRKTFLPEYWTVCLECEPDIIDIIFRPRQDAVLTQFKISIYDIPKLIETLNKFTRIKND